MAEITVHVLKPSVNNLTVRIFLRAAGIDFEEIDAWGKTTSPGVHADEPVAPDADDRGEGPAARRDVGELRDHGRTSATATGSSSSTRPIRRSAP